MNIRGPAPPNMPDPNPHTPRLGFVGIPGTALAAALALRALGRPVTVCCEDESLSDVASPTEVAHHADVVFLEASDPDGVDAILFAVTGLASGAPTPRIDPDTGDAEPGLVVVVFTPLDDDAVAAATERLAGYGIALAHAPLDPRTQRPADLTADEALLPVLVSILMDANLLDD